MVTAVLLVQNATPTTISQFHDSISNELPTILGSWNFELKIYLNNKYSKPSDVTPDSVINRYLYNLKLSYLDGGQTVSIINNNKSIVCVKPTTSITKSASFAQYNDYHGQSNSNEQSTQNDDNHTNEELDKENILKHINNGCCNALPDDTDEDFEMILGKLQSLWTLKQVIKGDGGFSYLLNVKLPMADGKSETLETFKLRTCNCFLHGLFKGFLIEIEHIPEDGEGDIPLIVKFTNSLDKIKQLIEVYRFPSNGSNLHYNVLNESKLDYLSDLCQQYCDALQF